MYNERITHARFKLPEPEVHAGHPLRNDKTHARLLDYLQQRLMLDLPNRDARLAKFSQIDRDVAAWMKLSEEDKKRKLKHDRDGSPQATAVSLPLTWVHLDDMMTYYAQTFAPNRGMFYHTAQPGQGEEAGQLVMLMNHHAIYGSYYRHLLRAIFNILKYNVGGVSPNWGIDYGPKLQADAVGALSVDSQPVFKGNKLLPIDMYNFFYDPAVEPTNLYKDGEWFAMTEMRSHYWLKNKCLEGIFFNCEETLDGECGYGATQYYRHPPVESQLNVDQTSNAGAVNWMGFMTGLDNGVMLNNAFELTTMYIKINPTDFGLIVGREARATRNRYEIWRFTILNNEKIIDAKHMNNIHGYLPAFFGIANDDGMREATKSPAEILNPLQNFASFLLNAHVLANRRNLYGTTFYDPSRVDYDKVPEGEVAARVPIKAQGYGQDIRTMVYHDNNLLDTKQTLQDLQGMLQVIDQFFPTQSLPSQIAGIDRAVTSQVAAVQQGTNRRQQKGARLLDDTMMRPMRFALYYNIVQYQEDGEDVADYFNGSSTKVNLAALRGTDLSTLIGQGLKAIDRQQVADQMREVIFALIQAPQTAQGIDLLSMLDYWTSMLDIDTNMKQFALPPAQPAAAPGATPSGEAEGIVPATAPAALAEPIYG